MISILMEADLWEQVLRDLQDLEIIREASGRGDHLRVGSYVLKEELIDAIVDNEIQDASQ